MEASSIALTAISCNTLFILFTLFWIGSMIEKYLKDKEAAKKEHERQ